MHNEELLMKIRKINNEIYKKQTQLIEMMDFFGIEENDKISLNKYINEINKMENELIKNIDIYKKRKKIYIELNKNL